MAGRTRRLLAGEDGPGARALPAGELLHPVPLVALALLVANDHAFKSWAAGSEMALATGKLSDFAGLLFFPLLVTAGLDLVLLVLGRLGLPVDFSLRCWKLAGACLTTAAAFSAINLSPTAAEAVARTLRQLGVNAHIAVDPTDLLALPMVALAFWLGTREIARVPLGRLEVIERAWSRGLCDVATQLEDVPESAPLAAAFERYLETGEAAPASAALRSIRAPTEVRPGRP